MSSSLDRADALLGKLERAAGVEASDPEDPWPELTQSALTRRSRCRGDEEGGDHAQAGCGYILTAPFERMCPLCAFRPGKPATQTDQISLPPLAEVLKCLADAKAATQAKAQQAGGKGKGKGKGQPKQGGKGGKGGKGGAGASAGQPKKQGGGKQQQQQQAVPDIQKAQFRVSKITSAKPHPDADALFILSVDVGEEKPRSVCAGLRGFFEADDLVDLVCVTITNLKPAKMKGVPSEAMVLAGDFGEGDAKKVRPLVPPAGAKVGDVVYPEGGPVPSSWPKTLSSTIWGRIVKVLTVQGGKACYDGKPLMSGDGSATVAVADLPDGAGIH